MNTTPRRSPSRTQKRRFTSGKSLNPGQATPRTRASRKSKATRLTKACPCQRSKTRPGGRRGVRTASGTGYERRARLTQRAVRNRRPGLPSPGDGGGVPVGDSAALKRSSVVLDARVDRRVEKVSDQVHG